MTLSIGARRATLVVGATSLAALLVTAPMSSVGAVADPTSTVFINELHYDNEGTDAGEFVEVAAPAGTDLTGWTVVRYNGANGLVYGTNALTGTVGDEGGGFGTVTVTYLTDGLQNGAPDGIALVRPDGTVEQFLSYEGTFIAQDGPADGLTSTDIGVSESSATGGGSSLGLTGSGDTYGAFTWSATTDDTPDAPNNGQTFTGGGPAEPVVSCPATVTTPQGTATAAEVSATDTDSRVASIAITSPPVEGITLTDAGDGTGTLNVAETTAAGEYPVVIEFTIDEQTTSCTVTVTVEAPPTITLISEIQGSEAASPRAGEDVVVRSVVTSLFTRQDVLDGFFVQEEDTDADDSEMTSEGLFVFCRGSCPESVTRGDVVEVSGRVTEFFGMTQIETTAAVGGSISKLSSDNATPSAATVALPAAGSTRAEATFESVEGMVVTFPGTLVVSEFFELARFGQIVLSADEVPYQFTHDNVPSRSGYQAYLAELNRRRIYLDDDNNDQNDAISNGPDEPYPYPTGGLALNNRFRVGDSAVGLTGVMHWSFAGVTGTDAWRIRPIPGVDYSFEPDNPAPAAPADVGGTLKVATFNVLNYFTTIDTTSSTTSGPCGPSGTLDCRGADSMAELERQRAKTVAAIAALDADIVGLIEIQNDAGASTADLVAGLNAAGAGPYAAIDTGTIGTDAIKVAFIYRTDTVTPVGNFEILDSTDDPDFRDQKNRPVLIQTFQQTATGERLTVAVNHFKSKGSDCLDVEPADPDLGDGQGNCPETRRLAAEALADFLATDPTGSRDPDFLIVGDLNSYRREPPITTLVDRGYTDLIEEFIGDEAYSFLFDGQLGYLDHALGTASLVRQVTGVAEWAINADEVPLFDYNDTVRDPGEATFERESTARELYAPDARRSSDHNPLVVGLDLDADNVLTVIAATIRTGPGARVALSGRVTGETFTDCPSVALRIDGILVLQATTTPVRGTATCAGRAANGGVSFNRATGAISLTATLPSSFVLADDRVRFELTLDDERFVALVTGRRSGAVWQGPV